MEPIHITSNDQLPIPSLGLNSWTNKIEDNINYPMEAKLKQVEGEVLVSFTVNEKGNLNDLLFEEKLGYGAEEEILNALRKAGKWEPAIINGKATPVKVSLPISFKKS